ncbi:MAG: gamma-glutamylcyclotransferase, partial [Myxococcota bacterium]
MAESTETNVFHVFGYGSLIFAPEDARHILNILPARLKGYRRAFCKPSRARGCPRDASFNAFPHVASGLFADEEMNLSLVLGTLADAQSSTDGVMLIYPARVRSRLIATLDRREGYQPLHPIDNNYIRRRHTVTLISTQYNVEATVYFWDENPNGAYYIGPLSHDAVARVLINATPIDSDDPHARGLHYLEGVRTSLRQVSIVDPYLEAIAAAVHRHPGPW